MEYVMILAAIALMCILSYKGMPIIPVTVVCSLLVGFLLEGGPAAALSQSFLPGFSGYAGNMFLLFVFGGLFGNLMVESGAAMAIGCTLMEKIDKRFAPYIVVLFAAICNIAGITLAMFTAYPIGLALFKAADIPKRFLPCCFMVGACSFANCAIPGYPSALNILPSQILGTSLYAAPVLSLVCALFLMAISFLFLHIITSRARRRGEHFQLSEGEEIQAMDRTLLPRFFPSLLPLLLVIVVSVLLGLVTDATTAVTLALMAACLLCFLMFRSRFPNFMKSFSSGCLAGLPGVCITASVVGFGAVVQATPAFAALTSRLVGGDSNPYLITVVAVSVIAGLTGSAAGSTRIFLDGFGTQMVEMGASAAALHRIVAITAHGFDSLPHAGGTVVNFELFRVRLSEGYKYVFVTNVCFTFLTGLLAALLATAGLVF